MDIIIEFVKTALPALFGGGAVWLFNIRSRIRRSENDIKEADFDTVSKVVKGAAEDLRALSERVGELEKEKIRILEELSVLHAANATLKKENERLERALRSHITKNNPLMK
jgi:cell division protein FtsB